jgi:aspartyl-tRNA(Asn)/glutamyl-tRNA(Gln) amidotransferase subunit A
MAKSADKVMEPFNAIIAPARSRPASPINEEFRKSTTGSTKDIMGSLGNGAGLPSISVPNGFTKTGLPTGIQFMGRAYEENVVIAVARSFQSLTDWHLQHPQSVLP